MRAKTTIVLLLCATLSVCASTQQKTQRAQAKDPKYQYNMGLVYLNQSNMDAKNIDVAINYFVKALALNTQYYLAWNAIGIAQSLKGNLQESAKAYQRCLEIYPDFSEARNNLGIIYSELGQQDKAEVEFQKVIADLAYQTREVAYCNLARLYLGQNRLDLAYDSVQKALRIKPRLAMAHNLKGMILDKEDKPEEAVASYEQAVKIVPEDILFNYNLAVAYYNMKEPAKAKSLFLKIVPHVVDPEMKVKVSQYLKDLGERKPAQP
ncbi:MAG: tetratricopeptide repeat protein [Candidatus Aminicenantales bacterium]